MITNEERIEAILEDIDAVDSLDPVYMKLLINDDMRWLCDYVLKVEKFLELTHTEISSDSLEKPTYMTGYFSALKDLRRDLENL